MGIWQFFRSKPNRNSQAQNKESTPKSPPPPLEDADYLLLFNQILEGLRLGWERQDAIEYLEALGDRGNFVLWANWLQRFGASHLKKNSPNLDLARRLVKLGKFGCGEFSAVAYELGNKLLSQRVTAAPPPANKPPIPARTALVKDTQGTKDPATPRTDRSDPKPAETDRPPTDPVETPVQPKPPTKNPVTVDLKQVKRLFEEGNQKFQSGDFAGAIAAYQQSLKVKPDFIEAWSNLGAVLFNLQEYEDALTVFNTAIDLKADNPNLWFNRGFSLTLLKRLEEANDSYEKCLQLKPDFMNAWQNRGVVLSQLKRYEEAVSCHEQALQLKPDFAEAWSNRGNALLNLGRHSDAIASYDKAIEYQPNYPDAWFNRGICFMNDKNYSEAISSLEKVIDQQPAYHPAWVVQGLALLNSKQPQEAIASFDKALELQPNDADVLTYRQEALKQLNA